MKKMRRENIYPGQYPKRKKMPSGVGGIFIWTSRQDEAGTVTVNQSIWPEMVGMSISWSTPKAAWVGILADNCLCVGL